MHGDVVGVQGGGVTRKSWKWWGMFHRGYEGKVAFRKDRGLGQATGGSGEGGQSPTRETVLWDHWLLDMEVTKFRSVVPAWKKAGMQNLQGQGRRVGSMPSTGLAVVQPHNVKSKLGGLKEKGMTLM